MKIKHPASFVLLILILVLTGTLTFTLSGFHVVLLVINLILIGLLRYLAHIEARHAAHLESP